MRDGREWQLLSVEYRRKESEKQYKVEENFFQNISGIQTDVHPFTFI